MLLLLSIWCCINNKEKFIQIAHAGGLYKNELYTNSMESITHNYSEGFRYFEIDIFNKDSELLIVHDLDIKNKYKIPNILDIVNFTINKPDAEFILDIKNRYSETLKIINDIILKNNGNFKNFIPQVYCLSDLKDVIDSGKYQKVLIANWKLSPDFKELEEILNVSKNNNIAIFGTSIWSKYEENYENYEKSIKYYDFYKKNNIPILIHGGIQSKEAIKYAKDNKFGIFSQSKYVKPF